MIETRQQLDEAREACRKMVTKRAALSAGSSVIPLPGLDIGTDVSILLALLPAINERFGLSEQQLAQLHPNRKKYNFIAITGVGSRLIGKTLTREAVTHALKRVGVRVATKSVARYIPFLGQALAAGLSFSAMKMLWNSHIDNCYRVVSEVLSQTTTADTTAPRQPPMMS
ncbi:hypothetical protein JZM24_14450 [Candidatus Sodalis endolongispinus]|uniref:DUF697 domain-containing protein n=1 Tax=Candidatus Sodalis endolongispinus TaxID=2812662 RepID=A0ABS5YDK8_9GAMM|nr:hypothetical protein [Candidatus Sodalis endolongispinus]MBT9433026.1 hypothetical protein [Candidatus Sodalis endolongispinus]